MIDFVRFPSTPYLVQPDGVDLRDDKVLTDHERDLLLSRDLHVEEKIDGENLGISSDGCDLLFQARGSYVQPGGRHFHGLSTWTAPRRARLLRALGDDLIVFGEWCAITHSVPYDKLPDWFLVFDVFERSTASFWGTEMRDMLVADLDLCSVPFVTAGKFTLQELTETIGQSRVGSSIMEGIVIRTREDGASAQRAKMVRPDFVQSIGAHWQAGPQKFNRIDR